jgi:hypothetical protein
MTTRAALRNPMVAAVNPTPTKKPRQTPIYENGNKMSSILKTEYNPL